MKKLIPAAFALAIISLTACDGSQDVPYEGADIPTGQRCYFGAISQTEEVGDEPTDIYVNIFRPASVAADAFSVQLMTSVDEIDAFDVPSTVEFAAGDTLAVVTIGIDPEKMTPGVKYPLTLSIDEAQANMYAANSVTITVIHASWTQWSEFGSGTAILAQLYSGNVPAKVYERHLSNNPKQIQYRFAWAMDDEDPDTYYDMFIAETADGGETLTIPQQLFEEDPTYGDIWIEDLYSYTGADAYKGLSFFDPRTGLFTFNVVYYCEAGIFGYGNEYLQLQ